MFEGYSNKVVPSVKIIGSPICFVGEAPGRVEDQLGKPFVGDAGRVLQHACALAGIDFASCSLTNAVPRRPPKNRTPTDEEVDYYRQQLINEINEINPKKIIALGGTASYALLGEKINVMDLCGTKYYSKLLNRDVYITFHPAVVVREPEYMLIFTLHLFRFAHNYNEVNDDVEYEINNDVGNIDVCDECAIDIETSGFSHVTDRILCVAIYSKGKSYVMTDHFDDIKYLLERVSKVYFYNAKFDLKFLSKYVREEYFEGKIRDVMIAARLAFPSIDPVGTPSMDLLARTFLGVRKDESLIKQYVPHKKKGSFEVVPMEILSQYCAKDSYITYLLGKKLEQSIPKSANGLYACLNDLVLYTSYDEIKGIRIDLQKLNDVRQAMEEYIDKSAQEIYRLAGKQFNINSTVQLRKVLFEDMGIKPVSHTPTGAPSTDEESLQILSERYPICRALLEYRKYTKLMSTFVDGIKRYMILDRVYPTCNLAGTVTGRTSSSNPNIQQIPREPKVIRELFMPDDNCVWVEVDLERAELYMLSFYSGDEKLLKDLSLKDFHTEMAYAIGLVPEGQVVDKETRMVAKQIVFGIAYGSSARNLATVTGVKDSVIQSAIDSFFERYPKVHQWVQSTKFIPYVGGSIKYLSGRVRSFVAVPEDIDFSKALSRRAINSPIQGTVADYVSTISLRILKKSREEGLKIRFLTFLHDAVHFSVGNDHLERAIELIKEEFKKGAFGVYIPAEVKVGPSWGETQELNNVTNSLTSTNEKSV